MLTEPTVPEPVRGADPTSSPSLMRPGENCWRVARADRFAFLVDGENYFPALRRALLEAQHSVLILAWDIDSRMRLVPAGANDGYPEPLGEFLDALVRRRRGLKVHALGWDYAVLFALEREWLQPYRLDMNTHRRLKFALDGNHPIGGSHHMKLVVIDDKVAFIGGLDLTRCRWDTCAHKSDEPLRRDADGKPYAPFHDVHTVLDGDCARALADLARERWRRATGKRLKAPLATPHDPWPRGIEPEIRDIDIAIARTLPAYDGYPGAFEVRQALEDAIASARREIFIEQQYFTSSAIGAALEARLAEPAPPEVNVLMARAQSGWLEDNTMGALRSRLYRQLAAVDAQSRFHMYVACHDPDAATCLNIHSKIMIVDDEWLTIGSANLSNRSLGLDTECNIAIEAKGEPRIRALIASLRHRLLAEHLETTPERVAQACAETGSTAKAIAQLAGGSRTLTPFEPTVSEQLEKLLPEQVFIDPEQTMLPEQLAGELIDHAAKPSIRRRLFVMAFAALVLAGMVAAWRWSPLREFVSVDRIVTYAQSFRAASWAPFAMFAAYLVAGLIAFPLTVLVAATGLVFGPWTGSAIALAGSFGSAALGFGVGHLVGRDFIRRYAGRRADRLSRRLANRGVLATIVVRVVPVAPFAVVNMLAGSSRLRFRDYALGTIIGMTPGLLLMVAFVDSAVEAVRRPSIVTVSIVVLVAALIIAASSFLSNRLGRSPVPLRAA